MVAESYYIEAILISKLDPKTVLSLYKDQIDELIARKIGSAHLGADASMNNSRKEMIQNEYFDKAISLFRQVACSFGLAKSLMMRVSATLEGNEIEMLKEAKELFGEKHQLQIANCDLMWARVLQA
jgi:hypothetical protein